MKLTYLYRSPLRDQHGRYFNPTGSKKHAVILPSIYMYLYSWYARLGTRPRYTTRVSVGSMPISSVKPSIVWLGHATFLIQCGGLNILTDPIFGSPSRLFSRHVTLAGIPEQLPPIDLVLFSHNHRDHLDQPSCEHLKIQQPHMFVPEGTALWFEQRQFSKAREFGWWQSYQILTVHGDSITCTFLPAHHWSGRGLFDWQYSLWGSWLIEYRGYTIYFAGDSGYASHFSEIGDYYGMIDVALLPIGPCEPRRWLKHSHLDTNDALQAFSDLKARTFVPMHWGTFPFGIDSATDPICRLRMSWEESVFTGKELLIPPLGQQVVFESDLI